MAAGKGIARHVADLLTQANITKNVTNPGNGLRRRKFLGALAGALGLTFFDRKSLAASIAQVVPEGLVPTNIPGAFAPAGQPLPHLQVNRGKTHRLRSATKIAEGVYEADSWSGFALPGNGWSYATGTWTVPTVSKPPGSTSAGVSASWVGIDGAYPSSSNDVLQAGILQVVFADGTTVYLPWFEWYCELFHQILQETSTLSPSLAGLNSNLYIAWKGDGNDNLNIMCSANNSQTFGKPYTSPQTSPQAPALCAHNGHLYIAWTGEGNNQINVAIVDGSGTTITGFSQQVILKETTPVSPSLASLNGILYLAWKSAGTDNLNVMYSADHGKTFGNKYTSPQTSSQSPALCAHNAHIYIAWAGDHGNDAINVAIVDVSGNAITGFSQKVTLIETTPVSPAMASFNGNLYLAWRGNGNTNLNIMYSANHGVTFGNKYVSPELSTTSPTLTVLPGTVFIAWKGASDKLNLSPLGLAGSQITGMESPSYIFETFITNLAARPGDVINCSVQYLGNAAGQITMINQTVNPDLAYTIVLLPPPGATFNGSTAEWIMEVPQDIGNSNPPPQFTPVVFTTVECSTPAGLIGTPQSANGEAFNIPNVTAVTLEGDLVVITYQ